MLSAWQKSEKVDNVVINFQDRKQSWTKTSKSRYVFVNLCTSAQEPRRVRDDVTERMSFLSFKEKKL
jgi:hypothetical protein